MGGKGGGKGAPPAMSPQPFGQQFGSSMMGMPAFGGYQTYNQGFQSPFQASSYGGFGPPQMGYGGLFGQMPAFNSITPATNISKQMYTSPYNSIAGRHEFSKGRVNFERPAQSVSPAEMEKIINMQSNANAKMGDGYPTRAEIEKITGMPIRPGNRQGEIDALMNFDARKRATSELKSRDFRRLIDSGESEQSAMQMIEGKTYTPNQAIVDALLKGENPEVIDALFQSQIPAVSDARTDPFQPARPKVVSTPTGSTRPATPEVASALLDPAGREISPEQLLRLQAEERKAIAAAGLDVSEYTNPFLERTAPTSMFGNMPSPFTKGRR